MDDIYITLTDFTGQRYVATVESEVPATSASLATKRTPGDALDMLRQKIVSGLPIECEIIHDNNRAQTLTVFHGPVTLSHHKPKQYTEDN